MLFMDRVNMEAFNTFFLFIDDTRHSLDVLAG